jgi:hypothetical protein
MSSPAFEAFMVRLLLEPDTREQFLTAPESIARAAALSEQEVAALLSIDRAGLVMAADSLRRKRAAQKPARAAHGWRRWLPR